MSAREKQTAERDDAQIIRSIRDGYGAPDLTPARRTAIDARVWERVERRRRFGVVTGMAVGAALPPGSCSSHASTASRPTQASTRQPWQP
jgi:hypothetical protein